MNTRIIHRIPKWFLLSALFALPLSNRAQAAVEIGVETSTIGHVIFNPNPPFVPEFMPRAVVDQLVDQDQSSGGGALLPAVSVNWDTNTQFTLTVSAPPGKKFSVQVPAGQAVGFGGFLWWESTRGGFSPPGSVTVSFDGLEGTPPVFSSSDSVLSDSHGFFGFLDLEGTTVTNDFAFSAIRLTGTVVPQVTGNGTEDYVPHLESAMQLYYETWETNDPGRFVFVVPVGPAPTNNVAPIVAWIQPTNGSVLAAGSDIRLTARATDEDGAVSFVDFFAGSVNLGRASGPPTNNLYEVLWRNAPVGTFQLHAKAVDNAGARGTSGIVSIVISGNTNSPPTNNVLPLVEWIRPTNGAAFTAGSPILLSARATDPDGTINFVEFFANSVNVGRGIFAAGSGIFNFAWSNAPAGTFQLHAEAVDNKGGRGLSTSVQILVRVNTNAPPTNNVAPVVTWVRPTNAVFATGSPILLSARATDPDGTINFVEFFANSANLGRGFFSPGSGLYNFMWSNAPAGIFQLHAEAVDNAGARGISDFTRIFVGSGINPIVDLGVVETSTIGHAFLDFPEFEDVPRTVVDYLIDQDRSSGGGGVLPTVSVNWDAFAQFKLTVSAPVGHKFVVEVPAGRAVGFGGFLLWESTKGGFSPPGDVAVRFTGLEGTPPEFSESDSVLSDSHGFFGFVDLEGTLVTNNFAFTSITLTGTVGPQFTGNGTENYLPHLESSMQLYYSTTETNDPGRFVSIVPAVGALPRVEVVRVTGTSVVLMIYGKAGLTHVVECSPDTVSWTPISTNVMPATVCAVCPFVAVSDLTVTAEGNRFYRVVELP